MNSAPSSIPAQLAVYARPRSHTACQFDVVWRCGVHKQGVVNVVLDAALLCKRITAELTAMQHLIETRAVLGTHPPITNLRLVFSEPAIQALHANRSDKPFLYPYAAFLTTRFSSAEVGIEEHCDWLLPRAWHNSSLLHIDGPLGVHVDIYRFGRVGVTRHAIEQFRKRANHLSAAQAFKYLASLVAETELERLPSTTHAATSGTAARLFHRKSKWCFVIVHNRAGQPVIATAYPKLS